MRWRLRGLRAKGVLVTALSGSALVACVAGLLVVEHLDEKDDRQVEQTVAIARAADDVLHLLVDAETGVRGFAATGEEAFLTPEESARARIPAALAKLDGLLDGQPGQEPGQADLTGLVERELAQLDTVRALAATGGGHASLVALSRDGKATMDDVRAHVEELTAYEDRLQESRQRTRAQRVELAHDLTLGAAAFGMVGSVGGAGLLMARMVRRLRRVERSARRLAAGQHVEDRDNGKDEIGSLSTVLADAAEQISSGRRRLQMALEVGRINVWETDAQGRMWMQGSRADEYGPTMEDGLATLHPEHGRAVRDIVSEVRADGQPRDYEVQSARDGRWFAGRVMRATGTGTIAVSVDVTALRQAQEELRESEVRRARDALAASEALGRYNELLITSSQEGIVGVDAGGLITSVNPAAAAMLGYAAAEMRGHDLHALVHHAHPDGRPYPRAECPVQRCMTSGVPATVVDEVFWRRDGTRLPVAYTVSLLDDDGMRGAVVTFRDVSEQRAAEEERERAAAQLRQGIRAGQLVLHHQPKIDLATGGCSSVESLVRWQREDGLVYPDAFVPLAEDCGVIGELTDWVIDAAAAQAAAWRADGLDLSVAVNVSGLVLGDDRVVQALVSAAERHGVPLPQLEVEVTETAAARNPDAAVAVLSQLADLQVRCALDDFGSGYSSLSYLKHLPVTTLKIDKSFVMSMPQDTSDQAIVAAAVHAGHGLGLDVVAEGVENELVLAMLTHADCDLGQGYLWSRPVPGDELSAWVRAHGVVVPKASSRRPRAVRHLR